MNPAPFAERLPRLAWIPLPLFLVALLLLWAAEPPTTYENPFLLLALNLLFSSFASLLIASLIGRSFFAHGRAGYLLLGCGVLFWGAGGSVGAIAAILKDGPAIFDPNVTVTIANSCYWLSALAHMIGAGLSLRWRLRLEKRRQWLCGAYGGTVAIVALITLATLAHSMPEFFVQGEGGTPVRQFVLASALILYLLSALLLHSATRDRPTPFASWYILALLLLAETMLALLAISAVGGMLNWAARGVQAVAGVYMLMATIVARKEPETIGFRPEEPLSEAQHPHAIAIALALAAAAIRMTVLHELPITYLTFNVAVILAALYGGFRAGITATVSSCLIVAILLEQTAGAAVAFVGSGVLIALLIEAMHRAGARAHAAETAAKVAEERERVEAELSRSLQEAYARIEATVEERTQELRKKEALLRTVLETLPVSVYLLNERGDLEYMNPAAGSLWQGKRYVPMARFHEYKAWWHGTDIRLQAEDWIGARAIRSGESAVGEVIDIEAFDGTRKTILNSGAPIRDETGRVVGAVAVNEDITAQQELQRQLLHAQKLESIGSLAGGVAHDFNNILTTIRGYAELAHEETADTATRENLRQVLAASDKAQGLTQKLLACSRQQVTETSVISLAENVAATLQFLSRIIGEDIRIRTDLCPEPLRIRGNAGQIEQILMNILINARDAMPAGGTLTIATGRARGGDSGAPAGLQKGCDYGYFRVIDSGMGIARKDIDRIFEPYFTTKETGKGTGLGLAIAYGIVRQHQGTITVASREGEGSTFTVYLPLTTETAPALAALSPAETPPGAERLLVVEDDPAVRTLLQLILEKAGYDVIVAEDAARALALFADADADVVLTDMIMPGMNGMEMYAEMRRQKPELKVIFASGYSADIMKDKGIDARHYRFLQKPLARAPLLRTIREVLDLRRPPAA